MKHVHFVSIPRTGTHSVYASLGDTADRRFNHSTARQMRKAVGDPKWKEHPSFSVVRNPFDRLVSFYHFCQNGNIAPFIFQRLSFSQWVRVGFPVHWQSSPGNESSTTARPLHLSEFVCDETGNVIVDRILRFENLSHEFERMCLELDLPVSNLTHINRSRRDADYRTYYGESDLISRVREVFHDDLEAFGYDF